MTSSRRNLKIFPPNNVSVIRRRGGINDEDFGKLNFIIIVNIVIVYAIRRVIRLASPWSVPQVNNNNDHDSREVDTDTSREITIVNDL